MIVSVVTRAASPSLLLFLTHTLFCALPPSLADALMHARCVSNPLAYTSHPPTLTQEHSADHRPMLIAAECAIAAMSAQMRFHVRSLE